MNVHPSKTEVRFRHGSFVHDFVRDSTRGVLMRQRPASSMPLQAESPAPSPSEPINSRPFVAQRGAALPFSEFTGMLEREASETPGGLDFSSAPLGAAVMREQGDEIRLPSVQAVARDVPMMLEENGQRLERATRRIPDTHTGLHHLSPDWERADTLSSLLDLRPMGQLHESFIIAAGRDGLWIIDQHVAHERILFEQVLRQRAVGRAELQQLLMPIVINLSAAQQFEYARIADELNATGFETEPFGQRTIAVKAAPAGLNPQGIEQVIFEILETAERELRAASLDEIRRGIAATIACRAAIKVNTRLEETKMSYLLKALSACEYPMTCPHGRPIALRYNTKDILKSFHRI